MGSRGPLPQPHARRRNTRTVAGVIRAARPVMPAALTGEARQEWRRVASEPAALGLLTKIDRAALALYCTAWGRWVDAEEALKQYGVMVKSPNGFPMQSPYPAVANRAMERRCAPC